MILGLSRSTIDFLSVFIGFRRLSRVKIVILNEIMTFMIFHQNLDFFSMFYFDPGVIWGRFRHPKSILFDRIIKKKTFF